MDCNENPLELSIKMYRDIANKTKRAYNEAIKLENEDPEVLRYSLLYNKISNLENMREDKEFIDFISLNETLKELKKLKKTNSNINLWEKKRERKMKYLRSINMLEYFQSKGYNMNIKVSTDE